MNPPVWETRKDSFERNLVRYTEFGADPGPVTHHSLDYPRPLHTKVTGKLCRCLGLLTVNQRHTADNLCDKKVHVSASRTHVSSE